MRSLLETKRLLRGFRIGRGSVWLLALVLLSLAGCAATGESTSGAGGGTASSAGEMQAASGAASTTGEVPLAGQVVKVEAGSLTLTTPAQSKDVVVQLGSDVPVWRDVDVSLADVAQGERVFAVGTRSGASLAAVRIRLGRNAGEGDAGPSGAGMPTNAASADKPADGATGARADGPMGAPLSGTVRGVGTKAITVDDGSGTPVTVTLAAQGRVVRQESVRVADISAGMTVFVIGHKNQDTLVASRVLILSSPPRGT